MVVRGGGGIYVVGRPRQDGENICQSTMNGGTLCYDVDEYWAIQKRNDMFATVFMIMASVVILIGVCVLIYAKSLKEK